MMTKQSKRATNVKKVAEQKPFSFGFKYKIKPKTEIRKGKIYYLTNTEPGHNKFYELWIENFTDVEYYLRGKYGKIGNAGKIILIGNYFSNYTAKEALNRKMKEQLNKGYILK